MSDVFAFDGLEIVKPDPSLQFIVTYDTSGPSEILRIAADGRIFWNGREVEADNDLRAVMRDVAKALGCSK